MNDQTIAANEARFRALVTATSDIVYLMSADWKEMRQLDGRGFVADTLQPTTDWQSRNIPEADQDMVTAVINEAIRDKKIFELEHRVLRADGSPGWTFSRAVPIMDDKGDIIEWFGTATDITDRKNAEEDLVAAREQSERRKRLYETITSGTPDLIYVFDLNYRFTYANSALLSMWGKTWDNAIGKGLLDNGYEPWHAEMHEREIDIVRATKRPIRGEVSFPHAVLGSRVYDYIFTPVFNEFGEVEAVAGTTRDITDRKQWERALEKSTEELQSINEELSASNEELMTMNNQLESVNQKLELARQKIEEGEIALRLAINAANFGTWFIHSVTREFITDDRTKELFGYYPDESFSIEQALAQITDEHREYVATKLEDAINNDGDYDVTYSVIGLHDKRLRWLRAIGNLKADPSGDFSAFTGVVMDITDRKLDEIRKNDFIGMVSHELKTPLTSLTLILQMLDLKLQENEDRFIADALSRADIQAKKMNALINGFLNISRLESAQIAIHKTEFDPHTLLSEIIDEAAIIAPAHPIIFDCQCSGPIIADRDKIGSVLSNLLSNAVKYSPQQTTITILCKRVGDEFVVSVRDEGVGIKEEDIGKIFDRYYRIEDNRTKFISGFGIGLYLSTEIVKRHEGHLWVESEPGKGSSFFFSLPQKMI